jgi:hypothetical protein
VNKVIFIYLVNLTGVSNYLNIKIKIINVLFYFKKHRNLYFKVQKRILLVNIGIVLVFIYLLLYFFNINLNYKKEP